MIEQYQTCCLCFFFCKWNSSLTPYRHDKTTIWPPHEHKRITSTSLSPHRLNTTHKLIATQATLRIQAHSHTGEKTTILPPLRRNTKKLQACYHTGNKTTSLPPTDVIQITSLLPHRRNTKTSSLPPHRRNTKQALSLQPHRQQNFFSFFPFSPPHRHNNI